MYNITWKYNLELLSGNLHIAEIGKIENKVSWVTSDLIFFPQNANLFTCTQHHHLGHCDPLWKSFRVLRPDLWIPKTKIDISLINSWLISLHKETLNIQLHSSLLSNCTMAYTYKCSVVFFGKRKVYNHS